MKRMEYKYFINDAKKEEQMQNSVTDLKKLVVGDKIILITSRNSTQHLQGKVLTITSIQGNGNYSVKCPVGAVYTVYSTNPADVFCLADRKSHASVLKKVLEEKMVEITKLQNEIDFLEKYESEEEFVAEKLMAVLNAKDKDGIVKILKEMKESHIL